MCHLSKGHATLRRSGEKALLIRISTLSPGGQLHREKYLAYCSDGMSDLGYPFSIHLFVDGKAYTGCCSTAKIPPVGHG